MKNRTYYTQFILEINTLCLILNSKAEYITLLKQIRTEKFVRHLCSVCLDFGSFVVIRSVFEIINPHTLEKVKFELGLRRWKSWRKQANGDSKRAYTTVQVIH